MIELRIFWPLVVVLLTGCAGEPDVRLGQDVASRHPIAVRDENAVLTIPVASQLDAESRMKIATFASVWRQDRGRQIEMRMPTRGPHDKVTRAQFDRIRHQLVAEGVRGSVHLMRVPVIAGEAPVILMRFTRIKADVVSRCGLWPDDLASASSLSGWDNEPYANFGCAYQTMMAVQTADPRDLAAMRAPSPIDGEMRARALGSIRRGQDPAVGWGTKAPGIGGAGN